MEIKEGYNYKILDFGKYGTITHALWQEPEFIKQWKEIFKAWGFGEEHIDNLRKYITPGTTAIDIGAHTGWETLMLALAVGKDGMVLAFDPNPIIFKILHENIIRNREIAEMKVFPYAIMSNSDRFVFYFTKNQWNGGYSQGIARGIGAYGNTEAIVVDGKTLKDVLIEQNITIKNKVSFIAIDTEGYDKQVLQSIDWLIEKDRPVLQVELYPALNEWERKELFWTLDELNYNIFLSGKVYKYNLGKQYFLNDFISEKQVMDFICISKDK